MIPKQTDECGSDAIGYFGLGRSQIATEPQDFVRKFDGAERAALHVSAGVGGAQSVRAGAA
jgi:hypothetical protein